MNFDITELNRTVERIIGEDIENATEVVVLSSKVSVAVWPFIEHYKDKLNEPVSKQCEPLCAGTINAIVTASGRFKFLRMADYHLIFWDTFSENEMRIPQPYTLHNLMALITDLHEKEGLWKGEEKAKREKRETLGL